VFRYRADIILGMTSADASADLRRRRKMAGLTQRELAARAQVAQPNIAAYESGRRRPAPETLVRPGPRSSVFDLAGFMAEVEAFLGVHVDFVSDRGTGPRMDRIRAEAVAL